MEWVGIRIENKLRESRERKRTRLIHSSLSSRATSNSLLHTIQFPHVVSNHFSTRVKPRLHQIHVAVY